MLDDTTTCWWYEQDGRQAGPVTAAAIARLVVEGRLGPGHRVWRDGMATWEPLSSVAELAPALAAGRPPPSPPPLSAPPPAWGGQPPSWGAPAPAGARPATPLPGPAPRGEGGPGTSALEEISPGAVVILSILTFGIYGLVKFHQTGKGYEALAGRPSAFSRNFWLFVGLGIASVLFHAGGPFVGVPFGLASLVFQVLTLVEALKLRDEAIRRAGIRPQVTTEGTHKALLIAGIVLVPLVIGIVLLLVQAAKWFSDWNAIGMALGRGGNAAPGPAGAVPGR